MDVLQSLLSGSVRGIWQAEEGGGAVFGGAGVYGGGGRSDGS